jgi:hypothetical protein
MPPYGECSVCIEKQTRFFTWLAIWQMNRFLQNAPPARVLQPIDLRVDKNNCFFNFRYLPSLLKAYTLQVTENIRPTWQTPWPVVLNQTIPTERPPLVGEVSANFCGCVSWSAQRIATAVNLGFLDRSRYFSIQVAPQVSSRGCGPRSRPTTSQKIW